MPTAKNARQKQFTMILIHYGELFTKGENRPFFQNMLRRNLKAAVPNSNVHLEAHRFMMELHDEASLNTAIHAIGKVFGVANYAQAIETDGTDIPDLVPAALTLVEGKKGPFKIEVSRSDKSHGLTSIQIAQKLAQALDEKGVQVGVKNATGVLHVEILQHKAMVYGQKHSGLGGLPVGCTGKVITLLSGGIDSPVASFLLAKRGVKSVYLHFHPFKEAEEAVRRSEKIQKLIRQLQPYTQSTTLYLVPYNFFVLDALHVPERYALPMFRRFMMRIAQGIAEKEGAEAIGTGENLAQVSSQTLSNLNSIGSATNLQALRPLLTYDKREIIALAEKIGTYSISNQAYIDCCQSLVAKHPATASKISELEKWEQRLSPTLMQQTLDSAVVLSVKN